MQIRLYKQPKGRAFLAEFHLRGRRRSSDRLTSMQTKLYQELLRAHPKDLRRAYLVNLNKHDGELPDGITEAFIEWVKSET